MVIEAGRTRAVSILIALFGSLCAIAALLMAPVVCLQLLLGLAIREPRQFPESDISELPLDE